MRIAIATDHNGVEQKKELIKYLGVISGKEYTLLNKRVTYIEDGKFHDAWVNS